MTIFIVMTTRATGDHRGITHDRTGADEIGPNGKPLRATLETGGVAVFDRAPSLESLGVLDRLPVNVIISDMMSSLWGEVQGARLYPPSNP